MITKIAAFVFKYSILFPGCFVPLLFPGIVDMMARSIVRHRGERDFWYNATLYAQHSGKYIRVCIRGDGIGHWIEVRQSNTDYFNRGFWLLRLWWAL